MARAVDQATKDTYVLVRFEYGDPSSPSYIAFTNWTFDIPGSPVYTSEPALELTVPTNDGLLDEKLLEVSLPISHSWFADLVSGVAQSPTFIIAEEITKPDAGGDTASRRIFFRGELTRTIKNYQGRSDYSIAAFSSAKSVLDFPLGVPATHHCAWTLFGAGCSKSKSGMNNFLTIDSVDGKVLTTTTTSPSRTGKFFHRGYAEYNGVRIGIRDWNAANADTFYLVKQPPASWTGKSVNFWAGCDKTIQTCRTRHSNEDNFGGMGYAMPAHNPILENPE